MRGVVVLALLLSVATATMWPELWPALTAGAVTPAQAPDRGAMPTSMSTARGWSWSGMLRADTSPPIASPATQESGGWRRIDVPRGERGHFLIDAAVNGTTVTFMIDSGASNIVLTPEDARRIGFSASQLRFTQSFRTANGLVRAAPVKLREVRIGQLALPYIDASVNEVSIGVSLLGMSFLDQLASWEVKDGRLSLYW